MKYRNLFAVTTLAVLAATAPQLSSQEAGRKRLAVPHVENQSSRNIGDMTDAIVQGLTRKKNRSYDVLERAQLEKVLGELGLGMTGVIDQSSAQQVGKMAGAEYVVLGTILSADAKDEQYTKPYDVKPPDKPTNGANLPWVKNEQKKAELTAQYQKEMREYEPKMREWEAAKNRAESIPHWRTVNEVKVSLKVVDVETGTIITTAQGGGRGVANDWGSNRPQSQSLPDSIFTSPASTAFAQAGAQILDFFDPLIPVVLAVHTDRKDKTVTINKGKDDGVHPRMKFIAVREGETIRDLNGKVVAVKKENIGDIEIISVDDGTAIGKVTGEIKLKGKKDKLGIERGDVLTPGTLERGFFGAIKEK